MFLRFLPFILTFVARKLRQQSAKKRAGSTSTGSRTANRRASYQKAGR